MKHVAKDVTEGIGQNKQSLYYLWKYNPISTYTLIVRNPGTLVKYMFPAELLRFVQMTSHGLTNLAEERIMISNQNSMHGGGIVREKTLRFSPSLVVLPTEFIIELKDYIIII